MAYTAVPTVTTGELWTAANHNTYVRDNFTELEARSVVQMVVQGDSAYNITDTALIDPTGGIGNQFNFPDTKKCGAYLRWTLPSSSAFDVDVSAIVKPLSGGNIYSKIGYYYGDIGTEDYSANSDTGSYSATAVTAVLEKINTTSITSITTNDLITIFFERDGADASDTVGAAVAFIGFLFEISVN